MASTLLQGIEQVIAAFEKLNIPYYIGGSIASSFYGEARTTQDGDLVADMRLGQENELAVLLGQFWLVDTEQVRSAIRQRSSFNLINLTTFDKVDVFVLKGRAYDRLRLERRLPASLYAGTDQVAYLASPEDILLTKLDWYRQSDEALSRQWHDVLGILKRMSDSLDWDYLRRWAATLDLAELLERACRDAAAQLGEPPVV